MSSSLVLSSREKKFFILLFLASRWQVVFLELISICNSFNFNSKIVFRPHERNTHTYMSCLGFFCHVLHFSLVSYTEGGVWHLFWVITYGHPVSNLGAFKRGLCSFLEEKSIGVTSLVGDVQPPYFRGRLTRKAVCRECTST